MKKCGGMRFKKYFSQLQKTLPKYPLEIPIDRGQSFFEKF
jgi:hypothetical protein